MSVSMAARMTGSGTGSAGFSLALRAKRHLVSESNATVAS